MDLPASAVVVFEENRTRADLYELWLSGLEVRVGLTSDATRELLDRRVAVAVVNQAFGDGAARDVVERVRSTAPVCRVIATRDRSEMFPALDAETQLVKPVFEAELREAVEPLVYRANYHLALGHYYQTTVDLSSVELAEASDADREEYDELQQRASDLQALIAALTREMTREDIEAVREAVSFDHDLGPVDSEEKIDSKYQPGGCSNCSADWDPGGTDPNVTKLGAYVWRCLACGHVQMRADPSHQDVATF